MSETSPIRLDRDALRVPSDTVFSIVAARFNGHIVGPMVERACVALRDHGVSEAAIEVTHVPGVFELPLGCQWALNRPGARAVIGLGAVVRGDTPHFDFVAGEGARGCMDVMLKHNAPVVFGVLTTDNEEQAMKRCDPNRGDKGYEAGLAALEMVALAGRLDQSMSIGEGN